MMRSLYRQYLSTPIGILEIVASDSGLLSVLFVEKQREGHQPSGITETALVQLQEYFAGVRRQFDVPLDLRGTPFQCRVWETLLGIGWGQTCSYSEVAKILNNPNAVRAVGAANGKNSVSIIVPCHRVIGANGTLTGYAGGLSRKAWLLAHETQTEH